MTLELPVVALDQTVVPRGGEQIETPAVGLPLGRTLEPAEEEARQGQAGSGAEGCGAQRRPVRRRLRSGPHAVATRLDAAGLQRVPWATRARVCFKGGMIQLHSLAGARVRR